MRAPFKALMAAGWTAALILTVVVAVDGQEQARHEQEVRDDIRTQLDLVRAELEDAMQDRTSTVDRLAAYAEADDALDDERFQRFAGALAATQPGIRSLHLVPHEGPALRHPANADGEVVDHAELAFVTDPRVVGPYTLPSGARALTLISPVFDANAGPGAHASGVAMVEVYLEPILGEAKVTGWPGDAVFALRGQDGGGEGGDVFYGDDAAFTSSPVTGLVSFRGGQWQIGATPDDGWPDAAPAAMWIRVGGGLMALMASVLVGVLVSEPVRLRTAVADATRSAKENEARFRSVSDTAQDAIITVQDDGRITYVNRAAERLYGYPREELLGASLPAVLPAEAALLQGTDVDRAQVLSDQGSVELLSLRGDGTEVPVEVSAASWDLGSARYQTAIIRDITERKRGQEVQARLAAVLDTTPDLVAIADPRGRIEYTNRAADRALGMDGRTARRGLAELFPKQARQAFWEEALPEALRCGSWRGEGWILGADGREIPVSQVLLAHHDEDDRVSAVALLARDIGEEKAAQEELQDEKERFRRLAEAAFEGIVIHEQGVILETNPAFARMTGHRIEDLVGKHINELVTPGSRATIQKRLQDLKDTPYEIDMQCSDGSTLTVEVAAKNFPYQGRVVRVVALRDVTERKRAENAQRIALERLSEIEHLKEIDQFKTHLLNTASHELNTPITPIRLQLHLLKNTHLGELSAKHRKAIGVLDRNVERLAILVQDVLDVARLQSGHLKVHREPVDVDTVVCEAVEAFEEPARQSKIRLTTRIAPDLWVEGDGHRLTQVLFNLLSNALKFTPEGGTIEVSAHQADGRAVVQVSDDGCGLEAAQIRRLFHPFSQVHDTMQTTQSGTGLGLYISKGIIDEHEGTIWCDSRGPGQGTTFGFEIPLATRIDVDPPRSENGRGGPRTRAR